MSKTILITGASRGFGKIWTEAFLKSGFNVAATARDLSSLDNLLGAYPTSLLTIQLDVTDKAKCFEVVNKAQQHFGKIDVLINNAGYGLFGTVEEASEQDAKAQFETNVFGSLWMIQAVLPVMRSQEGGHIIQLSSVLGITSVPLLGLYNSSKWAVEGLIESLASEVQSFGIRTTLVEPIAYATDFSGASGVTSDPIEIYEELKSVVYAQFKSMPNGDPAATAEVILKLVSAENPPARVFFGKTAFPWIKQVYNDRLALWESTNDLAEAAHG